MERVGGSSIPLDPYTHTYMHTSIADPWGRGGGGGVDRPNPLFNMYDFQ